jgi:hypothetical protein
VTQLLGAVVTVSPFDVALPFLVSAALLVVSSFAEEAISQRMDRVLNTYFSESGVVVDELATPLQPSSLASTTAWTVDAAQILSLLLAPVIGLLILQPHLGSALSVLYIASFFVAIAAFFGFTFRVRADRYHSKVWLRFFIPVVVLGVLLELVAAGVAAWAIGP